MLDELERGVHGDRGRALHDVQALVAASGAPVSIMTEPRRSGPAAGDDTERLCQKLIREMKGVIPPTSIAMNRVSRL